MRVRTLLVAFMLTILSSVFSRENTVTLSFSELRDFALAYSPEVKIIDQNYNLNVADRKLDLQWSNPELEYEREKVTHRSAEEVEQSLTLGKHLTLPWVYGLHRSSWNDQLQAAALEKESNFLLFLADLKTGYVEIKLFEAKAERLIHFQEVIQKASKIARDRLNEGALSGLEQQLIQLSLFTLDGQLLRIKQEKRSLENDWKIKLGISPEQEIHLTTPFKFTHVATDSTDDYIALISNNAGYKQRVKIQEALQKRIRLEQARRLPDLHAFGGYKQVNSDFKGYVVGLSVPLPIMNWNSAQIQKEHIRLDMANVDFEIFKNRLERRIDTKVKTIRDYVSSLKNYNKQFQSIEEVIENLVFSYQEGWISLGDILNGIQIYAASLEEYYTQLANYYRNIFELEALVNREVLVL